MPCGRSFNTEDFIRWNAVDVLIVISLTFQARISVVFLSIPFLARVLSSVYKMRLRTPLIHTVLRRLSETSFPRGTSEVAGNARL